jgi:hypothetical protein
MIADEQSRWENAPTRAKVLCLAGWNLCSGALSLVVAEILEGFAQTAFALHPELLAPLEKAPTREPQSAAPGQDGRAAANVIVLATRRPGRVVRRDLPVLGEDLCENKGS